MEGMQHGSEKKGEAFVHSGMADDVHVEFQVMELASMNMVDPEGKTHHVMASFMKNDEKVTKAVGKIKVIAPSAKEQIADLKDYGEVPLPPISLSMNPANGALSASLKMRAEHTP